MNLIFYIGLLTFATLYIIIGAIDNINPIRFKNKKIIINKFSVGNISIAFMCVCLVLLCYYKPLTDTYDTEVYISWLDQVSKTSIFEFHGRFRPGFELLSKIIFKICNHNYHLYFSILVIINCIIVFKAISNIDTFSSISFILYIGFVGLYYNYIVLRSGLAISCVLLSLSYIKKSKVKTLLALSAAVLFHETALIVLLAYIIKRFLLPLSKNKAYILMTLASVLYLTKVSDELIWRFANFLFPYLPSSWFHTYILYLDRSDAKKVISIYYILCYIISFIIIHFYRSDEKYNNYLAINIIGQLIFSTFSTNTIVGRVWDYMVPSTFIILLPYVFRESNNSRFMYLFSFLMSFGLYTRIIITRVPFFV